ncbi:restriction endonuclease [Flavihumibacter sp. R14]|nr:restriction endonuclease [Flavihumibacter soli]
MKEKKDWQSYEELIHQIYKELEPVADVRMNDQILGLETQKQRQIDISIRSTIAGHEILMIVQAKNHKKPADIKIVGEFDSVIRDIRASKGILICSAGFTKTAKEYAKRLKIDLYTAHDASKVNWQTEIQIPVIKRSLTVEVKIQHHYVVMKPGAMDHMHLPFPEDAFNIFMEKWQKDDIPKNEGTHYLELNREDIQLNENLFPLKSGVSYTIKARHHFKFFVPTEYRGLRDYITEKFKPTFMAFNEPIPFLNDGTWKYLEAPEEISLNTLHLDIEILDVSMLKNKRLRLLWKEPE